MNETKDSRYDELRIKLEQVDERLKGVIAGITKGLVDPETMASLSDEEVIMFRNICGLLVRARECVKSVIENSIDTEERLAKLERRVLELECEDFVHLENRIDDLERWYLTSGTINKKE